MPGKPENIVEIINCHAEGEVGDVIIGGVEPPPGETVWEQAQWIADDETLRNFDLKKPRFGGVFFRSPWRLIAELRDKRQWQATKVLR